MWPFEPRIDPPEEKPEEPEYGWLNPWAVYDEED